MITWLTGKIHGCWFNVSLVTVKENYEENEIRGQG